MMHRKVLITGASGFVGAHLARDLARAGYHVIALGGANPVPSCVEEVVACAGQIALADRELVRSLCDREQPDIVVHAAAMANATACERAPAEAWVANVAVTEILLSATWGIPFFFLSTDLVFDGSMPLERRFVETDIPTPTSVYSKTKWEAERLVLSAPQGVVLRVSLVYGERIGSRGGSLGWLWENLERGEAVTLYTDEWRTPILVHDISDVLQGLFAQLSAGEGGERLFHLGGADRVTRYEFGIEFSKILGFDSRLLRPASRGAFPLVPARPEEVSLSSARIERLLAISFRGTVEGLSTLLAKQTL